mgnify:FL=1
MNALLLTDLLLFLLLLLHAYMHWKNAGKRLPLFESVLGQTQRNVVIQTAMRSVVSIVMLWLVLYGVLIWRTYHLLYALGAWGQGGAVLLAYVSIFAIYQTIKAVLFQSVIGQAKKMGLST